MTRKEVMRKVRGIKAQLENLMDKLNDELCDEECDWMDDLLEHLMYANDELEEVVD